jgi:predicted HTH transcriptional regulator
MTFGELKMQVTEGEGEKLEFKKKVAFPEKIVREIVAFANTNGGELIIGIDDNGEISGLKFAEEEHYEMEKAIRSYCRPMISYTSEIIPISKKKSVIKYTIFESYRKPHYVVHNGEGERKAYVRVKDRSIQASKEIREILKRGRKKKDIQFRYGEKEQILMKYLDENECITVGKFASIAGLSRYMSSKTMILLVLANVLQVVPTEKEDIFMRKTMY